MHDKGRLGRGPNPRQSKSQAASSRGRARRLQNEKRRQLDTLKAADAQDSALAKKHDEHCATASTYVEALDVDAVGCHALGAQCSNNTDCTWCNGRFCALSEYCTDPDVLYQLSLEKICGRTEKEIKLAEQQEKEKAMKEKVEEQMGMDAKKKGEEE